MRETKVFRINGKKLDLLLFKNGDRGKAKDNSTMAIEPVGTVEGTDCNGLFVDVIWDNESWLSKDGRQVKLGKRRMVDGLELLES